MSLTSECGNELYLKPSSEESGKLRYSLAGCECPDGTVIQLPDFTYTAVEGAPLFLCKRKSDSLTPTPRWLAPQPPPTQASVGVNVIASYQTLAERP